MLNAQTLQSYIEAGLACDYILVEGDDGTHFSATIVAPAFEGKRRVQQHQMVYQVLGDRMKAEIHALAMQTYSPSEWATK